MDIKDYLSEAEILAQLAEEASELAQAALKLRRALDGTNPTPVSEDEARAQLREEYADVQNCIYLLFDQHDLDTVAAWQRVKMPRWLKRLEERG
ncbi:MAG: hypothetical protein LUF68_04290 [Clostridiales bacterium]|nr:hypothetical protein [Clostridiales bacterium]